MEKKTKIETVAPPPKDDAKKKMRPPTAPKLDSNTYKTMAGSSQYRFGVLAKIVKHMRTRHQDGDDHPLTLEEILDETNQLDVGQSVKNVSDLYIRIYIYKRQTKIYYFQNSG